MSRNKLSAHDRNDIYLGKPERLLKENDLQKIGLYLSTIRSKVLRDLCFFNLCRTERYTYFIEKSPKELAKELNISERKVYDLIKVTSFIGACGDVGFSKISDIQQKEC